MTYVEGFVAAVPTANKEAYRKHAADAAPLFKEFGVTRMSRPGATTCPTARSPTSQGAFRPRTTRASSSPGSNIRTRPPATPPTRR